MAKKKDDTQNSRKTPYKRVLRVIDEHPIAPAYIIAGISELLKIFNTMSDEDLAKYMDGVIAPDLARAHVTEIDNILNNVE